MYLRIFLCLIVSVIVSTAYSQQETKIVETFKTPKETVYNHLDNLQPDSYFPEEAAKSMFGGYTVDKRTEAAIQLKQFLDGKGLFVDVDRIPDTENYRDSAKGTYYYQLFPEISEIYLVKTNDGWVYSKFTTQNIERLHEEIYPYGSDWLLKLFPSSREFLGLQIRQWIGILALLLIAFVLYFLLKQIVRFIIKAIVKKRMGVAENTANMILKIENAASFIITLKFIQIMLPALLLPILVSKYSLLVLKIFFTVFMIVLAIRIADLFLAYFKVIAGKTENTLDDQLIPVVSKLLKSVIIIGGVFYILKLLNVNITALIAGISISGLALALAAQDTVKNLIGSVMIFFDKPFQIGDWINFDGKDGVVEEVGMRSTRIRSFENSLIYIPNGKLADSVVNNMGLRKYRRFKAELGLTYDTPPDLINAFIEGIREIIAAHPTTLNENYYVYLNNFGSSSLNILIYTFFNVNDWRDELEGKHEILESILTLADILGVRFAFPTQTLHIEEIPGQVGLSPTYDRDSNSVKTKLDRFVEDYKSGFKNDQ